MKTHQSLLVLCDLDMPGMNGLACVSAFRNWEAVNRKTRQLVFAMTIHASDQMRARCLAAGMDDFLPKPLSTEDLIAVLVALVPSQVE